MTFEERLERERAKLAAAGIDVGLGLIPESEISRDPDTEYVAVFGELGDDLAPDTKTP